LDSPRTSRYEPLHTLSIKAATTNSGGFQGTDSTPQWIQFDAHAAELEDLLLTDYHIYSHDETESSNVACDQYHVPKGVREHIDYITPGIRLRKDSKRLREKRSQNTAASFRDHDIAKRGFRPTNTGLAPIGDAVPDGLKGVNSSVCDIYVTSDCVRSERARHRKIERLW
jgi:tripeptidyl-peptidase-1